MRTPRLKSDPHRLAHAGLAAAYVAMVALFVIDGAFAHALCACAAALIYAALWFIPKE